MVKSKFDNIEIKMIEEGLEQVTIRYGKVDAVEILEMLKKNGFSVPKSGQAAVEIIVTYRKRSSLKDSEARTTLKNIDAMINRANRTPETYRRHFQ